MAHAHTHGSAPAGDRRILLAVAVNVALTVAQVVGGVLSGSLALIADGIHNLSDALSLVIAFAARRIARRPADAGMTFGYARAETVAALVNYTTLILIALYLVFEAVLRFAAPEPVAGWPIIVIACVALAVDLVTAGLTYALSKSSMNLRAAFLHNVADALGSVGVIVAGVVVLVTGWTVIDPIVTLGIAGYILWHAARETPEVVRVLMLGAPAEPGADRVLALMRGTGGVADVHHLHLWRMEEDAAAVQAHVVIEPGRWDEADAVKARLRDRLGDAGIAHVTLELECARHACQGEPVIGHKSQAASR